MLPTILSQLRAENFSSALKKLATSGGWFTSHLYLKLIMVVSVSCSVAEVLMLCACYMALSGHTV